MPPPYDVILARVKQKKATEEEWLLVEAELGPLLEGEQAFVQDADGNPVNFKIGDGTRLFSELPYFITYLDTVQSMRKLPYIDGNTDITITSTFRNNSNFYGIAFYNNSGSVIRLKVGTTVGGNEIMEIDVDPGPVMLSREYLFTAAQNVYLTGLNGNNYSLFVLYYQYDESPATLPTATGRVLYQKGTGPLPFFPVYDGHEDDVWDFVTGLGKPDSGYQNCSLMGFNGLPSMDDRYLVGRITGQAIGEIVGNVNNEVSIARANLPNEGAEMFRNQVSTVGGPGNTPANTDNITRARKVIIGGVADDLNFEMTRSVGTSSAWVGRTKALGEGVKLNVKPESLSVLYFIAIS